MLMSNDYIIHVYVTAKISILYICIFIHNIVIMNNNNNNYVYIISV